MAKRNRRIKLYVFYFHCQFATCSLITGLIFTENSSDSFWVIITQYFLILRNRSTYLDKLRYDRYLKIFTKKLVKNILVAIKSRIVIILNNLKFNEKEQILKTTSLVVKVKWSNEIHLPEIRNAKNYGYGCEVGRNILPEG